MDYKDYYKILGVDRKATTEEIKKAFRKLARKYHPDVNPGDDSAEQRFKEINEAHEVLTDSEKRQKYDQFGSQWRQWEQAGRSSSDFDWSQWTGGGFGAPGGTRVEYRDLNDLFGGGGMGGGGFSDFFEALFGGMGMGASGAGRMRGGARAPARGQDVEHEVEITLEEAYRGARRLLQVGDQRLEVKIPAGVKTGSRIRMAGKGAQGAGASGDLYLKVKVLPHSGFTRKGDDLYRDIDVDLYTAMLGGEVNVPTLSGTVALRIPAETQSGRRFRLQNQGMPTPKDPSVRGNLYVKVQVRLPGNLTEREKELFEELARIRTNAV